MRYSLSTTTLAIFLHALTAIRVDAIKILNSHFDVVLGKPFLLRWGGQGDQGVEISLATDDALEKWGLRVLDSNVTGTHANMTFHDNNHGRPCAFRLIDLANKAETHSKRFVIHESVYAREAADDGLVGLPNPIGPIRSILSGEDSGASQASFGEVEGTVTSTPSGRTPSSPPPSPSPTPSDSKTPPASATPSTPVSTPVSPTPSGSPSANSTPSPSAVTPKSKAPSNPAAPSETKASASSETASSGLSTGAKVGIGVGAALGGLAVLSIVGYVFYKRGKASAKNGSNTGEEEGAIASKPDLKAASTKDTHLAHEIDETEPKPIQELGGSPRSELAGDPRRTHVHEGASELPG